MPVFVALEMCVYFHHVCDSWSISPALDHRGTPCSVAEMHASKAMACYQAGSLRSRAERLAAAGLHHGSAARTAAACCFLLAAGRQLEAAAGGGGRLLAVYFTGQH